MLMMYRTNRPVVVVIMVSSFERETKDTVEFKIIVLSVVWYAYLFLCYSLYV